MAGGSARNTSRRSGIQPVPMIKTIAPTTISVVKM
ncbi:hypothetical protein FHX03_001673 [Rhizobium sp. BK456]|nr:hypothetical protein [Rhizobium sp. BK456]